MRHYAQVFSVRGARALRRGLASLLTFIALFPFLAVAPERRRD